jgi:Kef-type K+ transport system membrane component KefB
MTSNLLLGFSVLLITSAALGAVFRLASQPAVIGEILGGVLLGPTLLGALPGSPSTALFTADSLKVINGIGQVGIVLYVFTLGLQLDVGVALRRSRLVSAVALASAIAPFILALPVGFALYHSEKTLAAHGIGELPFVLFIGLAFSVTAVPVLARIIADRGLERMQLAQAALTSAIAQDLFSWLALAVILSLASHGSQTSPLVTILAGAGLVATLLMSHRVRIRHGWAAKIGRRTIKDEGSTRVVLLFGGAALTAAATSAAGLQPIIGAVVCGIACSRLLSTDRSKDQVLRLQPFLQSVLLPCYFLAPGLAINLRSLTLSNLALIAVMVAIASLCKVGSASLASRLCGLTWRQAGIVGVLMNARGLVELVLLRIGFTAGLVSPRLFTELVATAIITTALTGPLLTFLNSRQSAVHLSEFDLPASPDLARA